MWSISTGMPPISSIRIIIDVPDRGKPETIVRNVAVAVVVLIVMKEIIGNVFGGVQRFDGSRNAAEPKTWRRFSKRQAKYREHCFSTFGLGKATINAPQASSVC